MKQVVPFLIVALMGAFVVYQWWGARPSKPMNELEELYKKGALLIDVRTAGEVKTSGIPGAKHIPLQNLSSRSKEIPKDKDVILFCRSGNRSGRAMRYLKKLGWTKVHNGGSYLRWQPIVKKSPVKKQEKASAKPAKQKK